MIIAAAIISCVSPATCVRVSRGCLTKASAHSLHATGLLCRRGACGASQVRSHTARLSCMWIYQYIVRYMCAKNV